MASGLCFLRNWLHAKNPKGLYALGLFGYATVFFGKHRPLAINIDAMKSLW